jgi:(p)ppGpp synthase/HD superfamily hydrolase
MKYPKDIQKLIQKARPDKNETLSEWWAKYETLLPIAKKLVKERIPGKRKGLDNEHNYQHSFHVYEKVSKLHHWDDPDLDMFLAALLHDIVEDGNTSFEELVDLGFSDRTIELIYLCTHDKSIENHRERWIGMIAKLVKADNPEAWCIKLVDLADNIKQSHGLSDENRRFMLEVKAPIMLRLTDHLTFYDFRYHSYFEGVFKKYQKKIIKRA